MAGGNNEAGGAEEMEQISGAVTTAPERREVFAVLLTEAATKAVCRHTSVPLYHYTTKRLAYQTTIPLSD